MKNKDVIRNYVYIILRGENGEGGTVAGVFQNKKDAIKCALEIPCFSSGGWRKSTDPDETEWWDNGCDFVTVQEHEVL